MFALAELSVSNVSNLIASSILSLGAVFQGASLRKYPILPRERSTFDKVCDVCFSLLGFLKDPFDIFEC